MVHVCFLVAFVAWLSFGVSLALGTATADLCVDLEGFIVANADDSRNGNGNGGTASASSSGTGSTSLSVGGSTGEARGIEQVLGCVSNGTASSSFGFAGGEIEDTAQVINAELEDLGYTGPIVLDPDSTDYDALQRNLTRIKQDIDNGIITNPTVRAWKERRSPNPFTVVSRRHQSQQMQKASLYLAQGSGSDTVMISRLQGNVDAGLGYIDVLQEIEELMKCGTVREAYEGVESAICGTMLHGLDRLHYL